MHGHKDFPVRGEGFTRFSLIITSDEYTSLWTTPVLHLYVHYALQRRHIVPSGLALPENVIQFSIFISHGYLKHAGVGCRNKHGLNYLFLLIKDEIQTKESVFFAYYGSSNKLPGLSPSNEIIRRNEASESGESGDGTVIPQ